LRLFAFGLACLAGAIALSAAQAPDPRRKLEVTDFNAALDDTPAPDFAKLLAVKPAATLAEYNLYGSTGRWLTPYALNTPLFSDYALKFRAIAMPQGKSATYTNSGALDFPVGTTLIKTFAYPADFRSPDLHVRKIETRLLIRKRSGWTPLTYVWNAEQTQAVLKRAGARVPVSFLDKDGQKVSFSYAVPNQNQCKECHSLGRTLTPIGPKARNLNGEFAYPGAVAENQITHWVRTGLLKRAPDPTQIPATPRWDDAAQPLTARARAYLDGNCAHCHNAKAAASNSGLVLTYEATDPMAIGVGRRPVAAGRASGGLDYDIAPGRPDLSIMVHRMESTDPGTMMPELSRTLIDKDGVALIRAYIASMAPAGAPGRP
jgi:uncharacterized repeat protein (TIGR03806 family)